MTPDPWRAEPVSSATGCAPTHEHNASGRFRDPLDAGAYPRPCNPGFPPVSRPHRIRSTR